MRSPPAEPTQPTGGTADTRAFARDRSSGSVVS